MIMTRFQNFILTVTVCTVAFGVTGCSLPTVKDSLDRFVGTKFTSAKNPNRNIATGSIYQRSGLKDGTSVYYKKESEGPNTRYYISAWGSTYTDCRYSLLVSSDDIILSWRNEGPKHVSKCQHN